MRRWSAMEDVWCPRSQCCDKSYPACSRNPLRLKRQTDKPVLFMTDSLRKAHSGSKRSVVEVRNSNETYQWLNAVSFEVNTLPDMCCCNVALRPMYVQMLQIQVCSVDEKRWRRQCQELPDYFLACGKIKGENSKNPFTRFPISQQLISQFVL